MNTTGIPKIIVFDGYCNLCSGFVQFILKRDRKKHFRFASLQGHYGRQLLRTHALPSSPIETFLLVDGAHLFMRSTGALRVLKELPGFWPLCYLGIVIPPLLRDKLYNWVARNRYRWFGKRIECWIPQPAWKDRFLD